MLKFWIDIEPIPKGRPRFTRKGFTYTPKDTMDAERQIQFSIRQQHYGQELESPLAVSLKFFLSKPKKPSNHFPIAKKDLDNLVKLVFDALNGILWVDDRQICVLHCSKQYTTCNKPGIEIKLKRLMTP